MEFEHSPVLLDECVNGLNINGGGVYLDGTLGGAGHAREIARRLKGGRLIGVDQDGDALAKAAKTLADFLDRTSLVRANFDQGEYITQEAGITRLDGALLDLGVSSYQLDEGERGFSYNTDAPLDMRMDRRREFSAYELVNNYNEDKLRRVIWDYGEERWAARIARFIVEDRKREPIKTTFELVSVIKKAIPKGAREDGPHPARRTFQAIRIEVNREMEALEGALRFWADALSPGGRFCVITFHSLEDRMVKNIFRELENPCVCPRDFPVCACGRKPSLRVVTKKPVVPGEEELLRNRRARSAKLRIAERI